jgi:alpha-beta hydrolase superfamily lysophospholipase
VKDYKTTIENATLTRQEEKSVEIKEMRYLLSPVPLGIRANGKIRLPANASAFNPVPGVVLCHGFGANQNVMESGALLLVNKGIATIIFDLRGHGSSEGCLDDNFNEDVINAWRLLTSIPEVDSSRIALVGHSLGAFASIMAAKVVKPKAIVALSCPFDIEGTSLNNPSNRVFPLVRWAVILLWRFATLLKGLKVKVNWKKFLETWSHTQLSSALAGLEECNKLFIFSEDDKITPYKRFAQIYEKASEPKQKMLTGGSHSTSVEAEILRFEWVGWVVSALTA